MCCFVDLNRPMDKLESCLFTGMKNMLKLPIRTSNARLGIALGIPDLRVYLVTRLIKNLKKYKKFFHEECELYDDIIYNSLGKRREEYLKMDESELDLSLDENLIQTGNRCGIVISRDFRKRLRSEIYTWFVDRDHLLVRYLCNRGFFRSDIDPICKHCGGENSRTHATDECEWYKEERENTMKRIIKANPGYKGFELSAIIENAYFNPDGNETNETNEAIRKRIIDIVKGFILELYSHQEKYSDE